MLREGVLTALAIFVFYLILNAPLSGTLKLVLSLLLLYTYGRYAEKRFRFDGGHGLLLVKNRGVVDLIRRLSRSLPLSTLADVFLFVSFGLLSLLGLRGSWKRKLSIALAGYLIMGIIALLYPFSYIFLLNHLDGMGVDESGGLMYLYPVVGVGGTAAFSVVLSAYNVVGEVWSHLTEGGEARARATLLLPGINLPLLEGLLALAFVLIVHEFAHGIVAVREGIRVASAGLIFFGFLPVGGFVEPDERALQRAPSLSRLRVYVAGTMANFLSAFIAFILLMLFLYATTPFAKEGCLVVGGVLEKGTFIYAKGSECVDAKPNEEVVLHTDRGEVSLKANEEGKVGIYVIKYSPHSPLRYYGNGLDFVYNFLSLLFSLNMIVAVVNLLPAFVFDGAKIVEELLPMLAKPINAVVFIALIILFLPALL